VVGWGIMVAPFDFSVGGLPRDPVPVDAIPDIGENQQIVFNKWPGRSPRDVEDQVTYPLTVSLLGLPGVKTVRSYSMSDFSPIYVIFDDSAEFYWSRTRLLEKLASLSQGTLPQDARPILGPDATGLGQVFWYTLEGRDPLGNPAGGKDLAELRTTQDWFLAFSLFGTDMRQMFQVHTINLSVAIWVGFLALFGIATDDGVLMATYLDDSRARFSGTSKQDIREMVLQGAQRRIRPALMTSATTILALIPILTSCGRGADIMVPMAIPSFGGMIIALLTVFVVPVLYCWVEEFKLTSGFARK